MGRDTKHSEELIENAAITRLEERGVTTKDIAELVYFLQKDFYPELNETYCEEQVKHILKKREVQNAILTGIELDCLVEAGKAREPLQDLVKVDDSLYGIDEVLALSILNIYGSIGFTNYGYIDRLKPGILKGLNAKSNGKVHTFLDDIVGALAAAAASRFAHSQKRKSES
ncbi:phosphatidylglycerophosphatase A [Priestia megaterium]|nr:phosphatidylglycerophosphatase A [Priestia megaterium]